MPVDVLDRALGGPIPGQALLVERSDGHTSAADLDWWLRHGSARPPADIALLEHVQSGPALDVGCATGRHMEVLARRSVDVHGIDVCPEAIRQACMSGLSAEVADVNSYEPARPMRAVLALGGGIGLAGKRASVPDLLARLSSWLAPDGLLAVSTIDWSMTADEHRRWVDAALAAGRYPGEVRLRLRYGTLIGDWFDWVWLTVADLEADCAGVGLVIERTCRWGSWYGAIIRRSPS